MRKHIVTALILAGCIQQTAFAQEGSISRSTQTLAYGNDTYVSTNLVSIYVGYDRVGWYSISGWYRDGSLDAELTVSNSSDCQLSFEGTFYVGATPVQVVAWGPGFEIGPGETEDLSGYVSAQTVSIDRPLTFKPDGYVSDCE